MGRGATSFQFKINVHGKFMDLSLHLSELALSEDGPVSPLAP